MKMIYKSPDFKKLKKMKCRLKINKKIFFEKVFFFFIRANHFHFYLGMLQEEEELENESSIQRITFEKSDQQEEEEEIYDIKLPETMKGMFFEGFQEEIQLSTEQEVPEIFIQNQVIVRIINVGLNMFDAKIWNGDFGLLPTLYFPNAILGRSFSGVIVAVGKESKYEIGKKKKQFSIHLKTFF